MVEESTSRSGNSADQLSTAAPDTYVNHYRKMVTEMSPLSERSDFNGS